MPSPETAAVLVPYLGATEPECGPNTVWVAIQQVFWDWRAQSDNNNGDWIVSNVDYPQAKPMSAVGSWPVWVGRASVSLFKTYPWPPPD